MYVFWRRGYADTSLDLLGSATGLGRGSLYGAFGGKDELFRKCLDRYSSIYGPRYAQAMVDHSDDPVRGIEAFFGVVLDRIADPAVPDGCLVALSASQLTTLHEDSRARVQALLEDQRERVRTLLASSEADPRELDELAVFVVAVVQSLAVLSRAGTSNADLRSVVRVACAAVEQRLGDFVAEVGSRQTLRP